MVQSKTITRGLAALIAAAFILAGSSLLGCASHTDGLPADGEESSPLENPAPSESASDSTSESASPPIAAPEPDASSASVEGTATFIEGELYDRGFVVDETLRHSTLGDIHFSMHIPDEYDGSSPYALYIHVPGWEGWYSAGVGANLITDYVFVANSYVSDMIILSPQLEDWHETSADMVIALTLWALDAYNIDPQRVYLSGFSFGGDTISLAVSKRPELYSRVLHLSSQWDGDTRAVVEARVPLRMTLGDADQWYSASRAQATYDAIRSGYEAAGLSDEEIDRLIVLDVKDGAYFDGSDDQHGASGAYFPYDPDIMGWLFS